MTPSFINNHLQWITELTIRLSKDVGEIRNILDGLEGARPMEGLPGGRDPGQSKIDAINMQVTAINGMMSDLEAQIKRCFELL